MHQSNPGDYEINDEEISYEIIEIDDEDET